MNFREHLLTFLDKETVENLIKSFKNDEIHCFRLNTLKNNNVETVIQKGSNLKKHPHVKDAYIYNKQEDQLGKSILFDAGAYYIQEPAAMMAEYLLDVKRGDYILDMCAAPGGKSFNALIDNNDIGLLVCNDIHEIRSKILSSNIEKYGFKNALVLNDDSKKYKKYFKNYFDKIILDAPCSGSAMFKKNEEAENTWSLEKVMQCKEIQLSLLEDAYEMLKGKGRLLYSTCSFSIQENEDVIIEFLNKHKDIKIIPIDLNKQYNDTITIKGGLRLYPFKFEGEGQTIFILEKGDNDHSCNIKEMKSTRLPIQLINFLREINFKYDKNNIILFKNHYWYVEFPKFDLHKIKINRIGLDLGEMAKDRFIPSHSLAMYNLLDKSNFIELTQEQALDYLKGLTINIEGNSGFKVASYKGYALGWVKHVNNTLKNHYPKGLRRKF